MAGRATSGWRRSRLAVLLAVALVMLLSGCAAPWPFPQPTPDLKLPSAQQILRPLEIGPNAGDLATLDPARISFGVDRRIAQLIFPSLVALDEQQRPVDWAAERHEVSSDGLVWTFKLRKGMRWSDGTPIDANTYAYSINRALDPCTRSQADVQFYLYAIKGAQAFHEAQCPAGTTTSAATLIGSSFLAPDPLTLQIALEHPAGYFVSQLAYPTSWATPKQLIDQYGDAWIDHLADSAGFGGNLYKVTKWDHAGRLEMAVNENFWGQKPLLQKIQYTLYKDTDAAWKAYKAGDGDVGYPLPQELDSARSLKGSTFHQTPLPSFDYLTLNWHVAPFDDVRVRNAFSLALDRKAIATYTYTTDTHMYTLKGTMQPTIHLLPEGIPGYNPALSDAAGRSGDAALTLDLVTARKLAIEYAAEKCQGDFAKCVPVVIKAIPNRPTIALVAQALEQQWQMAFPHWPIIIASFECWNPAICNEPQFDSRQMVTANLGVDYPDPQNALSLHWRAGAKYDQTFVSVPEADRLLAQADGMSDLNQRIPLYQQAEQLLVNQGAAIPYAQPLTTCVVRSRVVGWSIASSGETPLSVWQATYLTR